MRAVALALIAGLALSPQAWAQAMHVMQSRPAAQAVMDGAASEFFVRFDAPVDHATALLTVVQDGRPLQVRHPRLGSQPNVLYASFGRLPPGAYVLRWQTRTLSGGAAGSGAIPFTVAAPAAR